MYRLFKKKSIVIFHTALILFLPAGNVLSSHEPVVKAEPVVESEMEILRLFYREKDLIVDSAARYPKHISKVAENVTVIEEEEIRAMNAHTVLELLEHIPGIMIGGYAGDFGSEGVVYIQGSMERHVLVLVDDIPVNYLSGGAAITNTIPVGIIRRIEIVRGPGSSVWGSSLGGIVNIVTKRTGKNESPSGTIRLSYGENNIVDGRGEASGKLGDIGYYLFAGMQDSGELMASRHHESGSLFSKWSLSISRAAKLRLEVGYSEPHDGFGDFPQGDMTTSGIGRSFVSAVFLESFLTDRLELDMSLYYLEQKYNQTDNILGMGIIGNHPQLYMRTRWDESVLGGNTKFVLTSGAHTVVLGSDYSLGKMDQKIEAGPILQPDIGKESGSNADIGKWAVYINDTITLGDICLSPGLRFDYDDISGLFASPSIGATYRIGEETILRASVARGFTLPPLSYTSGGGYYLDPNPSLDPEEVWSYQIGAESFIANVFWLKGAVFQHDLDGHLNREFEAGGPPMDNDMYFNAGGIWRRGFDIQAETAPFGPISFSAGGAFVNTDFSDSGTDRSGESVSANQYSYFARIEYDDKNHLFARLSGKYVWWDTTDGNEDVICDLNVEKSFQSVNGKRTDIFFTVRNLFNGALYEISGYKNPDRSVEAGIRLHF